MRWLDLGGRFWCISGGGGPGFFFFCFLYLLVEVEVGEEVDVTRIPHDLGQGDLLNGGVGGGRAEGGVEHRLLSGRRRDRDAHDVLGYEEKAQCFRHEELDLVEVVVVGVPRAGARELDGEESHHDLAGGHAEVEPDPGAPLVALEVALDLLQEDCGDLMLVIRLGEVGVLPGICSW